MIRAQIKSASYACGVINGDNSTCTDCNGIVNGLATTNCTGNCSNNGLCMCGPICVCFSGYFGVNCENQITTTTTSTTPIPTTTTLFQPTSTSSSVTTTTSTTPVTTTTTIPTTFVSSTIPIITSTSTTPLVTSTTTILIEKTCSGILQPVQVNATCGVSTNIPATFSPPLDLLCAPLNCSVCSGIPNVTSYSFDSNGQLSFTLSDPRCDASFNFQASCLIGPGDPCTHVNATTATYTVDIPFLCDCNLNPTPVNSVVISQTCSKLVVSWNEGGDSCTPTNELQYVVSIFEDGNPLAIHSITTGPAVTTFTLNAFTPTTGQTYYATVETSDSCEALSLVAASNVITYKLCVCGDGILDFNEECDVSGKPCCNQTTCKFITPDVICSPSKGDCDPAEYCTGASVECPPEVVYGSAHLCRPGNSTICDLPDYCPDIHEVDYSCPNAVIPINGTCDTDSNPCTVEICRLQLDASTLCEFNNTFDCHSTFCEPKICNTTAPLNIQNPCVYNPLLEPNCPTENLSECTSGGCSNDPAGCYLNNNTYDIPTCVANGNYLSSCQVGDVCGPQPSYVDVGICHNGVLVCNGTNGGIYCSGAVFPESMEICDNGLDDNCNGVADEGCGLTCISDSDCAAFQHNCQVVACNTTSHLCYYTPKAENTPCDDTDVCTFQDHCNGLGACVGSAVICPGDDQCNDQVCVNATGGCANSSIVPNAAHVCEDFDPCTFTTVCDAGKCNKTTVYKLFPPIDNECIIVTCNSSNGNPIYTNVVDGTDCSDSNLCTTQDKCFSGVCQGLPVPTSDGIPCTDDICNTQTGVITHPISSGLAYIDGTCYPDGTINASNPCIWVNVSESQINWVPVPVGTTCDDGIFCNEQDYCQLGVCVGGAAITSFYNVNHTCYDLVCNETGKNYYEVFSSIHTPCPDQYFCNGNEECDGAGYCDFGADVVCPPLESPTQCIENLCHEELDGCFPTFLQGNPCNDSNLCTLNDICDELHTTLDYCEGTPKVCTPGTCNVSSCDLGTGECVEIHDPTKCLINGTCYDDLTVRPGVFCQICNVSQSTTAWSNKAEQTVCNTGNPSGWCSLQDVCLSGVCTDIYQPSSYACQESFDAICETPTYCPGDSDSCPPRNYSLEGTPCVVDDFACTADVCNGAGTCSHIPNITTCECIPNGVKSCTTQFGDCLDQVCVNYTCINTIKPNWCLIPVDGCIENGNPRSNGCSGCDVTTSNTQWTWFVNDVICPGLDGNLNNEGPCGLQDTCFDGECIEGYAGVGHVCHNSTGICDPEIHCLEASTTCPDQIYPDNTTVCETDQIDCTTDLCDSQGTCVHSPTQTCECILDTDCVDTAEFFRCHESHCTDLYTCSVPVLIEGWCYIDDICRQNGEAKPKNLCQYCNPVVNTTKWTFEPLGYACGDLGICPETDTCNEVGECVTTNTYDCSDLIGVCQNAYCNYTDPSSESMEFLTPGECIIQYLHQNEIIDGCNPVPHPCEGLFYCFDGTCKQADAPSAPLESPGQCRKWICSETGIHASDYEFISVADFTLDQTVCDDELRCTENDQCSNGVCAGIDIFCPDGNAENGHSVCMKGACNPDTGDCGFVPYETGYNGSSIQDGNVCNGVEHCDGQGNVVNGTHLCCNDHNPCTHDNCIVETGCHYENLANGSSCDILNACTADAECILGTCVEVSPIDCTWMEDELRPHYNPCMYGECNPERDVCELRDRPYGYYTPNMQNANLCDGTEICDGNGNTIHIDVPTCHMNDICSDTCIPETGLCTINEANIGQPCNDGNGCTQWDMCTPEGLCVGELFDCSHLDDTCAVGQCTATENSHTLSCIRVPRVSEIPISCSDGDPCNGEEVCVDGACNSPCPLDCDDGNVCHTFECIEGQGCAPNIGFPCNDTLYCTINDQCGSDGECSDSTARVCDCPECDLNLCIYKSCVEDTKSCEFFNYPIDHDCNDRNVCNGAEVCDGQGGCHAIPDTVLDCEAAFLRNYCESNRQCFDVFCDPIDGCKFVELTGNSCDDGDSCTIGDTCYAGVCTAGDPKVCPSDHGTCYDATCVGTLPFESNCQYSVAVNKTCGNNIFCEGERHCLENGSCSPIYNPCPASTNDCAEIVCENNNTDVSRGRCRTINLAIGTLCNDTFPCTTNDTCDGRGECSGVRKDCSHVITKSAQCQLTDCDEDGNCFVYNRPNGTTCDDGNGCTIGDHCFEGNCAPGDLRKHCDDENDCTDNHCRDGPEGECYFTNLPDNHICTDFQYCTTNDTCQTGQCVPGVVRDCHDSIIDPLCETAYCNYTEQVCITVDFEDGTPCGPAPNGFCANQDACRLGRCENSVAEECDDHNPCTRDACNPLDGSCIHEIIVGLACDDLFYCTENDTCNALGVCTGVPRNCSGIVCDSQCQTATCNEETKMCEQVDLTDGTLCDFDCSVCTVDDYCYSGLCFPGPLAHVDDENMCTTDSCDPVLGPIHTPLIGEISCSNGIFCDGEEMCGLNGNCLPGIPPTCADCGDGCSEGFCNLETDACDSRPVQNGSPCTHTADVCAISSTCQDGSCFPVERKVCNDDNICTDDFCDPLRDCQFVNNAAPCNTGNLCSVNDHCVAGSCQAVETKDCSYLDTDCATGACDVATGECISLPKPDLTSCNDGHDCTLEDKCNNGLCIGLFFETGTCLLPTEQCSHVDACGICGGDNSTCALVVPLKRALTQQQDFFLQSIQKPAPDCFNGMFVNDLCLCLRGWAGETCNLCSTQGSTPSTNFLCVATDIESAPYDLREIPEANVDLYLKGTLPVNTLWSSIRPGTIGLNGVIYDCNCNTNALARRDSPSSEGLRVESLYRTALEHDDAALAKCQYSQLPTRDSQLKHIDSDDISSSSEEVLEHSDDDDFDFDLSDHHDTYKILFWIAFVVIILLFVVVIYLSMYWKRDYVAPPRPHSDEPDYSTLPSSNEMTFGKARQRKTVASTKLVV